MPELKLGLNDKVLFEATGRGEARLLFSPPTISSHLWSVCCSAAGKSAKTVEIEDIKFHQCVRLTRFENDRTISFIPPDGEFELMSYRLNTQVRSALCSLDDAAVKVTLSCFCCR